MLFIIENTKNVSISYLKNKIIFLARKRIVAFKEHAADIELNKYCIKNYKKPLKLLCLQLLNKITVNTNNKNELVISFNSNNYDKIAELITYGNGKIYGSKILQDAFRERI